MIQTKEVVDKLDNDSYKYWLKDANELTTALRKCCGKISLIKHSQKLDDVYAFESSLLGVDSSYVRQISLYHDDKELIFARTVITLETYEYFYDILENLGDKPIGDNFLYINDDFHRDEFIVRRLENFQAETARKQISDNNVYSRTSVFTYKDTQMKILITEYFLDLEYLEKCNDAN